MQLSDVWTLLQHVLEAFWRDSMALKKRKVKAFTFLMSPGLMDLQKVVGKMSIQSYDVNVPFETKSKILNIEPQAYHEYSIDFNPYRQKT